MKKVTTKIQDKNGYIRTIRAYLDDETWEILSTLTEEERHQYIVDEHYGVFLNDFTERRRHISLNRALDAGHDFEDRLFDMDDALDEKILLTRLQEALKTLTLEQQWLVNEVYFKKRQQIEIAKELGIKKAALNDRLRRILKKLKKILE